MSAAGAKGYDLYRVLFQLAGTVHEQALSQHCEHLIAYAEILILDSQREISKIRGFRWFEGVFCSEVTFPSTLLLRKL